MRSLGRRSSGFTLIELMLVVAIIGVLSAIAIPSFVRYQLRSKRSEAYANLAGIAKSQTSYFATNGLMYNAVSSPGPSPGTTKRNWDAAAETAYGGLGFRPEGNVFFDYEVNTACSCTNCFTATAYGDVDGDTQISMLMYVHPDADDAVCNSALFPGLGTPTENGVAVRNQVSWNENADDF